MDKNIDEFFLEEEFHEKKRKEHRQQRKFLKKNDRSKYKKTDLEKEKGIFPKSKKELSKGRVISITGEGAAVLSEDKKYLCSISGFLKNKVSKDKNIISVGDVVLFSKESSHIGSIIKVEKRLSTLTRIDPVRKKKQIIAVNIDQVVITASVVSPFLKPSLIDRYIIATEKGNMKPIIIINKVDLLDGQREGFSKEEIEEERKRYQDFLIAYGKTNIPIISVSCVTKEGVDLLKKIMQNKTSVFSGQSGTGKSSLINEILGTSLKTGKVVKKTYKGAHTTTTAILLPLNGEGFCIDTPGVKSFGLWDLKKEDIKNYFSEFTPFAEKCKYPNCLHINEPSCGVKEAVEKNQISNLRFESYSSLIKETEVEDKKR